MFSRRLTKYIAIAATAIAIGGRRLRHRRRNRQHQLRHRDDRFVHLGDISATPPRRGRIERSVWAGGGRIIGHGRERVRTELRNFDISRSEGDRQEDVIYEVPEGDKLELGGCHRARRKRPRARDDQRNDDHGQQGRGPADQRQRIHKSLGGSSGPLPAWGRVHGKAGRSGPSQLQPGVGHDRQRHGRKQGD